MKLIKAVGPDDIRTENLKMFEPAALQIGMQTI